MNDTLQRIEEAILKLPYISNDKSVIHNSAISLQISAALFRINDLPLANETTPKRTYKELSTIAETSHKLSSLLAELHLNGRKLLKEDTNFQIHLLRRQLNELTMMSCNAIEKIPRDIGSAKGGRPVKHQASELTSVAASQFKMLTGTQPTLSTRNLTPGHISENTTEPAGPFYEFVKELFLILNIGASPESQIKSHLEKTRKK